MTCYKIMPKRRSFRRNIKLKDSPSKERRIMHIRYNERKMKEKIKRQMKDNSTQNTNAILHYILQNFCCFL